jgi:hypothetical protein
MTVIEFYPKVPLADLTNDLKFDIPQLRTDACVQFLRRAAIHMATSAPILRRTVEINTSCKADNYRIESPDCTDVVSLIRCHSRCWGPIELVSSERDWNSHQLWRPRAIFREPNEIVFSGNALSNNTGFLLEISVAPQHDACEVDQVFSRGDYYETLLIGARAIAYDLPDKFWTNAVLAENYRQRFEQGVRALAITKSLNKVRGATPRTRRRTVL